MVPEAEVGKLYRTLSSLQDQCIYTDISVAATTLAMSQDVQSTPQGIRFAQYSGAKEAEYLPQIRHLISTDLSEPYSIYVYRYFLYQWADLCFMVSLSRGSHLGPVLKTL